MAKDEKKRIEMLFSDIDFGTEEYGYIPRPQDMDCDDEDRTYERYLHRKHLLNARVVDGVMYIEE